MRQLSNLEDKTILVLRIVALIGFAAMMIGAGIVTVDGLLRAFANRPIRGLGEIVDVSTAIVIATCFPIALAQRRNIRITLLTEMLGPAAQKALDIVSDLFLLLFVTIIAVQLVGYAVEAHRLGESSLIHRIPASPFWAAASAIMLLCVPAQALMTLITIARLAVQPTEHDRS